ncbi:hypothetical protein C8R46DRAFT_1096476 [Mycena filopes]|nr:hypothetical protein C8R46DRAFT_1096476 [Mycena filopes]
MRIQHNNVLQRVSQPYFAGLSLIGPTSGTTTRTCRLIFVPHLRLRHLHFGIPDDPDSASSACILQLMTMPALETLSIPWLDISPVTVVDFLIRSSAPLRKLAMALHSYRGQWTAETIDGLLRALPCLTHLDLQDLPANIFEPIAIRSLSQLPSLCSLTVHYYAPTRSEYEDILRVLRTRPKIQSLRIIFSGGLQPDPDILVALRELVAGGMEIYVGPEGTNLV